ncbi:32046_t:CDS:1, partial [Gigaspora margarita]
YNPKQDLFKNNKRDVKNNDKDDGENNSDNGEFSFLFLEL